MKGFTLLKYVAKEYGYTILGTIQRLPILYLLDAHFRINSINTKTFYFYSGMLALLFLLSLKCKSLARVYSVVTCFIFMLATWPMSKGITWSKIPLIARQYMIFFAMQKEKLNAEFYLKSATYFALFAIFMSIMLSLVDTLKNINRRLCFTGILMLGNYLATRQHLVGEMLTSGWMRYLFFLEQQVVMTILTYDVFRLNLHVHYALNLIYTSIFLKDISVFVYIIFGIAWHHFHKDEHPLSVAWESVRRYINEMPLNKENIRYHVVSSFLPYSMSVCICLPFFLYYNGITQPGSLFLKTITVMCSTLLGTGSYIVFITNICFGCIMVTMWFLCGRRYNDLHIMEPITPGIIFLVLGIQSVYSGVEFHGVVMCLGIFVATPSLLEDIHKISEPVFLDLGTSCGSLFQNFKGILLYLFLISFPILVIVEFLKLGFSHNFGLFWTLVVTSSWISVSIEALETMVTYSILLYDNFRSEPFEKLDDTLYFIKAITGVIQIGIGILNICFITWNITTIQWSWTGCLILAACLYSTFDRVKTGWSEFQRRRFTVQRLSFLSNATRDQLQSYNDVCAICLRTMTSGKVTPCNHFFHESCLKRWSYVRKTCPLCNKILNMELVVQR